MVAFNPKGRRDAYIGIRDDVGRRSSILHLWTRRGQVYVAAKGLGGVDKISFHTPTYCQHAYDMNLPLPPEVSSRQSVIWHRTPTPARGLLEASCGFTWQVPTDTLSVIAEAPPENVQWIPAMPASQVTILDMGFTAENEGTTRSNLPRDSLNLFWPISAAESFFVYMRSAIWDRATMAVPASHHERRHLIISGDDPENTGRPVRFSMFNHPKDGQALVSWDLGGYWTDTPPPTNSTLRRQTVVARSAETPEEGRI